MDKEPFLGQMEEFMKEDGATTCHMEMEKWFHLMEKSNWAFGKTEKE